MTLDEARSLIAGTRSPAQRAAAEQLLNEAIALPNLPPAERDAAFTRIRQLEPTVPDYQLASFGASVLETIGDSLTDTALRIPVYAEALNLAEWYASCATSGGEGAARSRHVHQIEVKLRALDPASRQAWSDVVKQSASSPAPNQVPPAGVTPLPPRGPRPAFLTALGWTFIIVGGLGIPVSLISLLMILAGAQGTASGTFFGGLIVIGGPPVTLVAGIGLLRRWRWAHGYAVALLTVFAAHSLVQVLRGSTPEENTVSPSGVITTTMAWSVNYPLHLLVIAISVGLLVKLLKPAIRAQFAHRA
jgi:hypothetical protein